jgi:uncharacterized coiled-coil protein SlyX
LSAEKLAELEKLKTQLEEKEKQILELSEKLKTPGEAPAAASGGDGQLGARIKELEARLSEYEIIAEDIADLSFYKEENQKLQKQIDALKTSSPQAAEPAPAVPPQPVNPPAGQFPMTEPEAPAAAAAETPAPVAPASAAPAVEAAATAAPPATETPVSEAPAAPIDDELMREFAAAVEAQKTGGEAAPAPASAAAAAGENGVQNAQLLNQFEQFVKKD